MTRKLLEQTLLHLNSQHLSKVNERYGLPGGPLHEKTLRDRLVSALKTPEAFQRLIDTLTPFEHQMLWYVKTRGGTVNGWELVGHALCISDGPPDAKPIHLFTTGLRDIEANTYLYPLFQDLLIVPTSQHSSWLHNHALGTDDYRVQTDPRILELLPPPPPVTPLTYPVVTRSDAAPNRHPLHLLAQLVLVWRHLHHEGPLKITQQGHYPKATLQALGKHLHLKPSLVEVLINTMVQLGVLKVEDHHITVQPDRFKTHLRKPLQEQHLDVVHTYLKLYGGNPQLVPYTWIILQALSLLPGPVDLPAGLRALEEGFLGAILVSTNGRNRFEHPMQAHQITDTHWNHFELLGLLEVDWQQNLMLPTEGLKWISPLPFPKGETQPTSPTPGMLIQPNFEALIYLSMLTPEHLQTLLLMNVTRMDQQTLTAQITKASFLQGVELLGFDEALNLLREASMTRISPNVISTLYTWANRLEGSVLRSNVTLLEFPNREARDQHLHHVTGYAQKVGNTRLLVHGDSRAKKGWVEIDYRKPLPQQTIRLTAHGELQVLHPRDLITQSLVERHLQKTPAGTYRFKTEPLKQGHLTLTQQRHFEHRLGSKLPAYVEALTDIHTGISGLPTCEEGVVFCHPRAQDLAEHPQLRPYLKRQLTPTVYLVAREHQTALNRRLGELGLTAAADPNPPAAPTLSAQKELI